MSEIKSNGVFLRGRFTKTHRSAALTDHFLGRYKSEEFVNLVKKWSGDLEQKKVLKTDLNEEAFGEDQILFSLSNNAHIFGLDISEETVKRANLRQAEGSFIHHYLRADIRDLPFSDNSFDIILSISTLDHFVNERDLTKSLLELKRVIKLTGVIIIAMNNKHNPNFYLSLKLGRFLGLIPYPVKFYSLAELCKMYETAGLSIQGQRHIVHIFSPLNSLLLLLRRYINASIIDTLGKRSVAIFKWVGNKERTNSFTGWFIALKCVRK